MHSFARLFISLFFLLALAARPAGAAVTLSDPIVINITEVSAQTGVSLQVIDLDGTGATGYYSRDKVVIEAEVVTNSTAPGSARTLTVYYALSQKGTYTAAQMATAAANQECALPNATSTTRVYSLPVVYANARFLYLWLDHSARDSGSTLTVTLRVNGVGR